MKKIISILLTILMTVCCFSPYYAFAEDCKNDDAYFTQEEFESFEHTYAIGITSYTNGLITDKKIRNCKKRRNHFNNKRLHLWKQRSKKMRIH